MSFGKIVGIEDLVTFEGESVKKLTDAFHDSVDHYIVFCAEHNKPLQKSYSGVLNVRLTPDMHRKVAQIAAATGTSINSFIRQAVAKALSTAVF